MIGKYLLFNLQLLPKNQFNQLAKSELVVYEVLRVIDNIPLFYEEHIERLKSSCLKIDKGIKIDADLFYSDIKKLIRKNEVSEGNLMIKIFFHSNHYDISVFIIPHSYPLRSDYQYGVEVSFLSAERINPEAKVEQAQIREKANEIISEKNIYEVLLLDRNNQLTEGSRSNLFFIKNNALITSTLSKVLKGITLGKVLEIADQMKINIEFRNVNKDELSSIDAMFITGTSPKILPVCKAENFYFDTKHSLILKLMEAYDQIIYNYVSQKKGTLI